MDIEKFKKNRMKYLVAAMVLGLFTGVGYSWSVFQSPMMEKFGWELSAISLTFTIQVAFSTIIPVFLSPLQKKMGVPGYLKLGILVYVGGLVLTRFTTSLVFFYISFGVIVGLGIGMLYPTLVAYSTKLFPDNTGLASGLLAFAYGSGAILWAPLGTRLTNTFGILSTFMILAILYAIVMFPASFFIHATPEGYEDSFEKHTSSAKKISTAKDLTWQEMTKTPAFYIILIALTIGATSGLMITGHATNIMREVNGFSVEQAALYVGFMSIFNSCGRLIFGSLSDKLGRFNTMIILYGIIGIAMLVLANVKGFLFVVAIFSITCGYGGFTAMISPVCADLFGIKNLSTNYTFLYLSYGFAGIVGPQLAAYLHTTSGSYLPAFTAVSIMCAVGIALILFLSVTRKGQVS